jgi:ribonuclease E
VATEDDDEELTFDAEAPQAAKPKAAEPQPEPTPAKAEAEAPAPEPAAEATPKPTPAPAAAPTAEAKPAEAAAPSRKPSRSGMAIAACLGVCVLTSTIAAVQSWRAASIAADASSAGSTKDVIAKLNALQTLMEQQRDAIDELSTRPGLAAASASPQSVDGQINALAAAVKANQQMAEQLPSVVMKQVDARLARAEPRRAAPAPSTRPPAARPAAQRSAAPKRAPERSAEAAKVLSTPIAPAVAEKKRPAGEEISYP